MNTITTFLKQTRNEMRHVIWPSHRRAMVYTIIILVLSLVLGYLLNGFDLGFRALLAPFIIK